MGSRYLFYQSFFDSTITEDNIPDDIYELKTISGEKFHRLLDLCFEHADIFSFTDNPYIEQMSDEFINALKPFLVKSFYPMEWFYERGVNDPLHVCIYEASEDAKKILLSTFEDLFLTPKQGSTISVDDLCFFKDGKAFLGTITHEYYCITYPPTEGFMTKLKGLGRWIDVTEPWYDPFEISQSD